MNKVFYLLSSAITVLLCLIVSSFTFGERTENGSVLKNAELVIPSIEPGIDPRENNIYVAYIMNPNIGSMTEIYRSTSSGSGFTAINTIPADDQVYEDLNLKSRTTYYYKVRAVKNGQYSQFSEVMEFRTNAYNYPPDFTAKAINETTIELTLKDNSYNDVWYDVAGWSLINGVREEVFGQHFISMADSGRTEIILHNDVKPGTTYEYTVYMGRTYDDDFGLEVGSASATTPLETPYISGDQSLASDIYLMINNPNQISLTEIYRSLSAESGYTLIATIASEEQRYVDHVSKSSIYYYYKVRAVKENPPYGHLYSAFSNYDMMTAMGETWSPEFTAKAINEKTVELTVTDRSYQDNSYYIEGFYIVDGIRTYIYHTEFIMSDSGSTTKITHDNAIGGTQYEYIIYMSRTYDDQFDLESGSANATTPDAIACAGRGSIERELWTGISGTYVTSIPVNMPPSSISDLTSFETPTNEGSNYGARVRGYLCVPFTADYTFWIASDDRSELWISTDDDPAKKSKIASVTGYTGIRQWTKYPSQTSVPVHLEGGRRYYIEALHKEALGADHLAVGWKSENNPLGYALSELPIPGNRLIKFDKLVNKAP